MQSHSKLCSSTPSNSPDPVFTMDELEYAARAADDFEDLWQLWRTHERHVKVEDGDEVSDYFESFKEMKAKIEDFNHKIQCCQKMIHHHAGRLDATRKRLANVEHGAAKIPRIEELIVEANSNAMELTEMKARLLDIERVTKNRPEIVAPVPYFAAPDWIRPGDLVTDLLDPFAAVVRIGSPTSSPSSSPRTPQ